LRGNGAIPGFFWYNKHSVKKVDGFVLTRDGMCKADRPKSERTTRCGSLLAIEPEAWIADGSCPELLRALPLLRTSAFLIQPPGPFLR